MNARKLWDGLAWAAAGLVIVWTALWAYVNTLAGPHPPEWVYSFLHWHQPLSHWFVGLDLPPAGLVLAALFGLALYLLPSAIASSRRAPSFGSIFAVNVLFGWTVLGWLAALGWALTDRARSH